MSPEQLLGQLDGAERVVLADLEAGLGTLTRMAEDQMDLFVVIAEPSAKSVEVAKRAVSMIRSLRLGDVVSVANRVADEADRAFFENAPEAAERVVPESASIRSADVQGVSAFDFAPRDPAVRGIGELAISLVERGARS